MMISKKIKPKLKAATRVVSILSFAAVAGLAAQQEINLTASGTSITMPDVTKVPMWGYSCGAPVAGATCVAANPNAAGTWSPVIITVPYNPAGTNLFPAGLMARYADASISMPPKSAWRTRRRARSASTSGAHGPTALSSSSSRTRISVRAR